MENQISVLLAALVLCGSAAAQSSAVNPNLQGRTRAAVQAELACAQASGEYAVLNSDHFDPQALDAARARAATTPQCLSGGALGRAAPVTLQRSRADVQAELACAQATGEYAALNTEHFDPQALDAARARVATTPACQPGVLGRSAAAVLDTPTPPARLQRTRAEVQAEVACAQATGELQAINSDHYDPAAIQAARARAATTPACQNALALTAR